MKPKRTPQELYDFLGRINKILNTYTGISMLIVVSVFLYEDYGLEGEAPGWLTVITLVLIAIGVVALIVFIGIGVKRHLLKKKLGGVEDTKKE